MKKQIFKQSLLTTLALLLGVTLLVGCGSDDDTTEYRYNEPEETEAVVETEADVTEIVEETDPTEYEALTEAETDASMEGENLNAVVFLPDDRILALGDDRALFDEVLGEGREGDAFVSYLDNGFNVRFDDDDRADFFVVADFEEIEFPIFDANRSISALTRDLMFGDFIEAADSDHLYNLPFEYNGQNYMLMVELALENGELSHVGTMVMGIRD